MLSDDVEFLSAMNVDIEGNKSDEVGLNLVEVSSLGPILAL